MASEEDIAMADLPKDLKSSMFIEDNDGCSKMCPCLTSDKMWIKNHGDDHSPQAEWGNFMMD